MACPSWSEPAITWTRVCRPQAKRRPCGAYPARADRAVGPRSLLVADLSNVRPPRSAAAHLAAPVQPVWSAPGQVKRQQHRSSLPVQGSPRVEEDQAGLAGSELLDGSGRVDPAPFDPGHRAIGSQCPPRPAGVSGRRPGAGGPGGEKRGFGRGPSGWSRTIRRFGRSGTASSSGSRRGSRGSIGSFRRSQGPLGTGLVKRSDGGVPTGGNIGPRTGRWTRPR